MKGKKKKKTKQLALIEDQLINVPGVEGTAPARRSRGAQCRALAATTLTRATRNAVSREATRQHVPAAVMPQEVPTRLACKPSGTFRQGRESEETSVH